MQTFSDRMGWERKPEYICELSNAEPYYERIYAVREPIVRCKNCKHATELLNGTYSCSGDLVETWDYYNDEPQQNIVPPDGFCAWGERVEGSEDETS